MLMSIWMFIVVVGMIILTGFVMFVYGFYAAINYMNLPEDEIKYDEDARRLAKVGSWIIEKCPW